MTATILVSVYSTYPHNVHFLFPLLLLLQQSHSGNPSIEWTFFLVLIEITVTLPNGFLIVFIEKYPYTYKREDLQVKQA